MRIPYETAVKTLKDKLISKGAPENFAGPVAETMVENSLVGTYTHGINRFARLIQTIENGSIDMDAEAVRAAGLGGYEVWDGRMGFGIINATKCTKRAIELANTHGIACVALRNTNHWLRGGTYGGMIADAGMLGICFTNTINNTVAWGSRSGCLGNNPLALAIPGPDGNIAADMAMSQFSYGKLELARLNGEKLPYDGGFDTEGNVTRDPVKIMESRMIMPTGMWKGSALSLLLDLAAAALSQGNTVLRISALKEEKGVCQIFIAVNYKAVVSEVDVAKSISETIENLTSQPPLKEGSPVRYPGQNAKAVKEENLKLGIPVDERVWAEVLSL